MKRSAPFKFVTPALAVMLFAGVALTGCDSIAQVFGLNEIDVTLGSVGQVQLQPDSTLANSGSVNIGENVPSNVGVREITVLSQHVTYTPSGRSSGGTCPLTFWILVNEVSAANGSLTVNDDTGEVSNISSNYATAYNRAELCAAWPFDECPLAPGDRTSQQISDTVDQALHSGQLSLMLIIENPGECAGLLGIEQLRFDLSFF